MTIRSNVYRVAMASLAVCVLALAGCATPPRSMAYQIHDAYGRDRVQDKASNEEHRKESNVYQNAVIAAGAIDAPSAGLSGIRYENLALSLATIAIDMAIDRSYDSPWTTGLMPRKEGETIDEAVTRLHGLMVETFEEGMRRENIGFEVYKHFDFEENSIYDSRELTVYLIHAPEYGCAASAEETKCAAIVRAGFIRAENVGPLAGPGARDSRWRLPFNTNTGTTIEFSYSDGMEGALPAVDLYQAISEVAPDWMYFFMPDSAQYPMLSKQAEVKGYPYFLNQGRELHFVTPKSDTDS